MAAHTLKDIHSLHVTISQLLQQAGWKTDDPSQVSLTLPLVTYIQSSESGLYDYCLYRENGQVLAIIEVQFTCKDLEIGEYKAVEYINQLEKKQPFRPFAYQSNGQEIFIWNDAKRCMQRVDVFFCRQLLEDMLQTSMAENKYLLNSKITEGITEDRKIWEDFKKGDYTAFTSIYKKHIQPLYNFGSKITSDRALVEDCIHDLFVELWKSRQNLCEVNSIKYYLFKSLKRKLIRSLGKKSAQHYLVEDYNFEFVFSHEFALITSQITQEQEKNLAAALRTLSDRQREAIFLRFYEGFSYEEIASVMSITVKTAYNFVYMALSELRKNLVHLIPVLLMLHHFSTSISSFLPLLF
ncbi:sigma-70 family RNA polymerase sigma factor [Rhodocytophaga rosea]|uniref:Sigma-70 family RNA polymerase sigma factor n=1 Tax=Rhodocytophaga rosea TaxID=2704465 RepID=A0A6C0GU27_9BACT|nr:sigma-70 family RNA polymerase sigma factor [Rhodocytophaga rosea]QHT71699.1 sigma-70 family RNA polymerase sigma factor [Rhodocytophaga rosea]